MATSTQKVMVCCHYFLAISQIILLFDICDLVNVGRPNHQWLLVRICWTPFLGRLKLVHIEKVLLDYLFIHSRLPYRSVSFRIRWILNTIQILFHLLILLIVLNLVNINHADNIEKLPFLFDLACYLLDVCNKNIFLCEWHHSLLPNHWWWLLSNTLFNDRLGLVGVNTLAICKLVLLGLQLEVLCLLGMALACDTELVPDFGHHVFEVIEVVYVSLHLFTSGLRRAFNLYDIRHFFARTRFRRLLNPARIDIRWQVGLSDFMRHFNGGLWPFHFKELIRVIALPVRLRGFTYARIHFGINILDLNIY